MAVRVLWREIGGYSGPVILGTPTGYVPKADASLHLVRSHWLACEVETGNRLGSVMMADGTAVTAGLDQHILVYPAELADEDFVAENDQGALPSLLMEVWAVIGIGTLRDAFLDQHWTLERRADGSGAVVWDSSQEFRIGKRTIKAEKGAMVHGALLRDTMTPIGGKVPKAGERWERSKAWALLFNELFARPETEVIQAIFGRKAMSNRASSTKIATRENRRGVQLCMAVYGRPFMDGLKVGSAEAVSEHLDLAMAVWHSFAVNAPSLARKVLEAVIQEHPVSSDSSGFARALTRALRVARGEKWQKRYERTRKAVMASGLWDKSLTYGRDCVLPA